MRDGFVKAAAGTPKIRVADCEYNAGQIIALMEEAAAQGVKVLALPELCVTGYTCGDLFLQDTLLKGAEDALARILEQTAASSSDARKRSLRSSSSMEGGSMNARIASGIACRTASAPCTSISKITCLPAAISRCTEAKGVP